MRHSYAWEYSGQELADACTLSGHASGRGATDCQDSVLAWSHPGLVDRYMSVTDTLQSSWSTGELWGVSLPVEDACVSLLVFLPHGTAPPKNGRPIRYEGRMVPLSRWVDGGDSLVLDTTASRFTGVSIAGIILGLTGVFAFAVVLSRWSEERMAWLMNDRPSRCEPITPEDAAQVVFCLEQLEQLMTTKTEHEWLWRLRAKVVRFTVKSYNLRELASGHVLTNDEKSEIVKTDPLLRSPAGRDVSTESDETRKVRAELQRRLQGLTTLGVGARTTG
jgi:hypothetical protein